MQLIRRGRIAHDEFVRVLDDAPVPDGVPVIVPAERLLADADDLARREAPTGVLWPNDRRVAELAPHLGRLALVALDFPKFKDGRAYSQARQLREHYRYRGELRAIGDVLRDQFLFLERAGFDAFEVKKDADALAFAEATRRYSVFYQPTGDGRCTALRARLARGVRNVVGATMIEFGPERAAAFDRRLAGASPEEIVAEAVRAVPAGRLAVASSFGIESAVLLAAVAAVDRTLPVIFLDTGWLFPETLEYRDEVVARLELRNVRTIRPDADSLTARDPRRDLWRRDADACCRLRKVEPLAAALEGFSGWINGRKRYQGGQRATLPVVELEGVRLKFNPLARITREEIEARFERSGLPRHPLASAGYASIGCMPCTSRLDPGEIGRAGRWRGRGKTECGIHLALP
jgi:phosphoadenosine phosphosulfate reductase